MRPQNKHKAGERVVFKPETSSQPNQQKTRKEVDVEHDKRAARKSVALRCCGVLLAGMVWGVSYRYLPVWVGVSVLAAVVGCAAIEAIFVARELGVSALAGLVTGVAVWAISIALGPASHGPVIYEVIGQGTVAAVLIAAARWMFEPLIGPVSSWKTQLTARRVS